MLIMPFRCLAEESEHAHNTESHYHRNHVGLLVGNTHEKGKDNFHLGNWTIGPEFNVDFTEGEVARVFGVSFGYGF